MDWVFVGIMVGSIAYLALIVLTFVETYRENKIRISQSRSDVERTQEQLDESEHARREAEDRANKLQEEALQYEQQVSELQSKIRLAMPGEGSKPV